MSELVDINLNRFSKMKQIPVELSDSEVKKFEIRTSLSKLPASIGVFAKSWSLFPQKAILESDSF